MNGKNKATATKTRTVARILCAAFVLLLLAGVGSADGVYLTQVGSYNTAGHALGVAISGSYAYVADGLSDLVVVNISDPTNPTLAGSYNTAGLALDVAVSGSYAYVVDLSNCRLVAVNISDPINPTLAGSYNTLFSPRGVAVSGSYAYVADGANGLVVVNISDPTNPTLAGSYNTAGNAYGVAVSGSYAYVADGLSGLVVVNISDPTNPTLAGSYNTVWFAYGVAVSGNYAYVADDANGLVVVNISDPTNPTLAGSYNTAGDAWNVEVAGIYAYVADGANGLVVVNISNPTNPTLAGSYNTAGLAREVAVSGSYAYIAYDFNGLVILDQPLKLILCTDKYSTYEDDYINFTVETFSPFQVSYEWDWNYNGSVFNSSGDTGRNQNHSWSTYGYYTVAVNGTDSYNVNNISTVNITVYSNNPVPPVLSPIGNKTAEILDALTFDLAVFDWNNDTITYNATGLPTGAILNNNTGNFSWTPVAFQSGNYSVTFTATDPGDLNDSETIVISVNKTPPVISAIPDQIFTNNSALTLNLNDYVSDLDTLKTDLTWTYSGNSVINVSISEDNNVTFTTDIPYWTGEEIITFTVTDPDGLSDSMDVKVKVMFNISLAGSYDTAGGAQGVAISGSYAYVADVDGLVAVNISDPTNPTLAGSYNTTGNAWGVAVSGSYTYVADTAGLVVVDISDPTNPTLAGSYNTTGDASDVTVSGSYAYVADGANGLAVVNISDPANPTLAGSYNTAGYALDVVVSGSYAYVTDWNSGLLVVVNISDPTNPTLTGSYNTAGVAWGVAVSGSYAYVTIGDNGLVVVDISDPTNPTLTGSYNTAELATGVVVSGNYAYVADSINGLVVVNISDPTNPTLAGSYNTAGHSSDVAVSGSYAYVADDANGLVILSNIPSIQLNIESLPEYSINNTIPVNYTIINPYHLGVENVSLYYNHGSGWILYGNNSSSTTGSFIFVPPEDGYYEFYCATPGWIEESPSIADTHTTVDLNPPDTTLYSYAPDPTSNTILHYTGTSVDTAANIQSVEYRIQRGAWIPASPVDSTFNSLTEDFEFTTPTLADGTYFIEVRSSDILDHVELTYASDTITIDTNTPPTLAISYPTPTSTTGTNTTLIASTNEPATVKYDFVDVNYTQMNYTFSSTGITTHTTPLTNLPAGSNTIYVAASDLSGNINTTIVNVTWNVDSSGPQLSQILINNKTTDSINTNPNITTVITSTFYPIIAVEYFIDTIGPHGTGTALTPSGTYTQDVDFNLDISPLSDGEHTIYLHAANQIRWGGYQAAVFTIDSTPPPITFTSPANGSTIIDTTPQVSFTITDPGGVNLSTLLVNGSPAGLGFNATTDCLVSGTEVICTFTVDTPYPDPSTNNITVDAADNLGNPAQTRTEFYVDSQSSAIYINSGHAPASRNITISIWINVTEPSGLGAATVNLTVDPQVLSLISVNGSDFDSNTSYIDNDNGTVRIVAYQTGGTGVGPGIIRLANVTVQTIGNYSDTSPMDLEVETFKNNTGVGIPYYVTDGTFLIVSDGDFSGDGTTDSWDITYLARSITGIPGYEPLSSGDVSGDGVVDAWDCTYLARAIAGVPGYDV
ncbi:MAG: putative Ig domain-containing protein [Bacteroidales bacterium]|nr:putative Ig domain-containing protein [Bacteroidales bacterium]